MASTADISIKVVANAAGFGPPLTAAEKQLIQFDNKAREIGSAAGGLAKLADRFGPLVAGIGAISVGQGFIATMNRLDDVGDYAEGIGDTAANISRLHFAAEQMGSSAEAVDSAIAKMVKSIGNAAIEGGPAADAIGRIGLSVEDLTAMRPSEAFKAISGAIGELPTVYDKASVASGIFGKGAIEIISILKSGAGDIDAFGKRLDEIGGTITDVQVEAAARLKDQVVELGKAWEGTKAESLVAIGPAAMGVVKLFSAEVQGATFAVKLLKSVYAGIFGGTDPFTAEIEAAAKSATGPQARAEFQKALEKQEEIAKEKERIAKNAEQIARETKTPEEIYQEKADAAQEALDAGLIEWENYIAAIDKYANEYETSIERIAKADQAAAEKAAATPEAMNEALGQFFGDMGTRTDTGMNNALAGFFGGISDGLKDFGNDITRSVMTPLELFEEQMQKLDFALQAGAISQESYARAVEKAQRDVEAAMNGGGAGGGTTFTDSFGGGGIGGDMPGMSGGSSAFWDYNLPRGGFVGGSVPDNYRVFDDPAAAAANGGRRSGYLRDFTASSFGGDDGMSENNRLLSEVARNSRNQGVYA